MRNCQNPLKVEYKMANEYMGPNIFWTAKARNFKFGLHFGYIEYHPKTQN